MNTKDELPKFLNSNKHPILSALGILSDEVSDKIRSTIFEGVYEIARENYNKNTNRGSLTSLTSYSGNNQSINTLLDRYNIKVVYYRQLFSKTVAFIEALDQESQTSLVNSIENFIHNDAMHRLSYFVIGIINNQSKEILFKNLDDIMKTFTDIIGGTNKLLVIGEANSQKINETIEKIEGNELSKITDEDHYKMIRVILFIYELPINMRALAVYTFIKLLTRKNTINPVSQVTSKKPKLSIREKVDKAMAKKADEASTNISKPVNKNITISARFHGQPIDKYINLLYDNDWLKNIFDFSVKNFSSHQISGELYSILTEKKPYNDLKPIPRRTLKGIHNMDDVVIKNIIALFADIKGREADRFKTKEAIIGLTLFGLEETPTGFRMI